MCLRRLSQPQQAQRKMCWSYLGLAHCWCQDVSFQKLGQFLSHIISGPVPGEWLNRLWERTTHCITVLVCVPYRDSFLLHPLYYLFRLFNANREMNSDLPSPDRLEITTTGISLPHRSLNSSWILSVVSRLGVWIWTANWSKICCWVLPLQLANAQKKKRRMMNIWETKDT